MKFTVKEISYLNNCIMLPIPPESAVELNKIKADITNGKKVEIELKTASKKRSQDANSYLWVLLDKLAKVLHTTKEEVYRHAIQMVGVFEIVPVNNIAVDRFKQMWGAGRLGWIVIDAGPSKTAIGVTNLLAYYGSSVYNTQEMSRLIEYVVDECKQQGIETLPQEDLNSLCAKWGMRNDGS